MPPPEDDGLEIAEVGPWSRDKHHFLGRYLDAFTTAMKDKRWSGLYYIDLFAGPGICRIKGTNELIWGSPLIAAQAPHPFDGLFFCDAKRKNCKALSRRIESVNASGRSVIMCEDANTAVKEIVKRIPDRSLSLAFLDPFGLQLEFETIRKLSERRCDLIIFFPDHLDALRNCEQFYEANPSSNLDKYLGPSVDWRAVLHGQPRHKWATLLREKYVDQLRSLGYKEFDPKRISAHGRPLYLLIYCSRHAIGVAIWRRTSRDEASGQRGLFE